MSIRLYDEARKQARASLPRYRARLDWDRIIDSIFRDGPLVFNANNPLWYDAAVNAVAALCNTGFMEIYTGTQPTLNSALTGTKLAKLTFGATAFGASSGGTATANAIGTVAALATGTAGYFALMKSDDTTVVMTGSVGTSGADLNFNTLSITSGINVSCSSFTITG